VRSSFAKTKVYVANRLAKFGSKQNAKTKLHLLSKFGSKTKVKANSTLVYWELSILNSIFCT